jgi:hypothetical protein
MRHVSSTTVAATLMMFSTMAGVEAIAAESQSIIPNLTGQWGRAYLNLDPVHSENLIRDIGSHGFLESGRLVNDDLTFQTSLRRVAQPVPVTCKLGS